MKLEYDKDVDAAYIYIQHPIKEGAVKKTVEAKKNIILDFDEKGRLIGIEVLNASKVLKSEILATAAF